MKPYQEEYLTLLRSTAQNTGPQADRTTPEAFVEQAVQANRASRRAIEQGTQLLRQHLFPLLDDILAVPLREIEELTQFAALLSYARHYGLRDMLIRELYQVAMSLYNLETMLSPTDIRLFSARVRLYFTEAASFFDTAYDDITDPETRGYIHRSMGNIALGYTGNDPQTAQAKLRVVTRSISVLSDPDVRAKTPSLPWDTYLYKSHQERTSLLSFLRTGLAGPDAFAQVLESAQVVQDRQLQAARERGRPLEPRWQYAYLAARYHIGAMPLEELLDGLEALSNACADDDFSGQSTFTHIQVTGLYLEYSKSLRDPRALRRVPVRLAGMLRRMLSWIVRAPSTDNNEQLMFYLRGVLYAYREYPETPAFIDLLENVFAARHPATFARMWIAGRITRQLTAWALEDCPQALVGVLDTRTPQEVRSRREALLDFALTAGRLYDTGMVHFINLDASACRGLFEEEDRLIQQHARCGATLLESFPSTQAFAPIALGHHRHFNEKGGFPADFDLSHHPLAPLISIVAAADTLVAAAEETSSRYRPVIPFDQACAVVLSGRGTRYAPFVSDLLQTPARRAALADLVEDSKRQAYLEMYRRRAAMTAL